MSVLKVIPFGGIRLAHNNLPTEVIGTREDRALPAYLLLQCCRALSRQVFASVFW